MSLFSLDWRNPRKLWRAYIVAVSAIICLLGISHFTALSALSNANDDATIINLSGRQRTLNQFMLYYATMLHQDASSEARADLKSVTDRFETAHKRLLIEAASTPKNKQLYFSPGALGASLDEKVRIYISAARQILADPSRSQAHLATMRAMGPSVLHDALDTAVFNFEARAKQHADELRAIQNVSLGVALIILVIEALAIFAPAQRAVNQALSALENQKTALQDAYEKTQQKNRELAQLRQDIEHDALHDPLTGLANRRGLEQQIQHLIRNAMSKNGTVQIMHIDLDRFKQINDTLGHAAGDFILQWVAKALEDTVKDHGFIARVGGDEFVVVIAEGLSSVQLSDLAGKIIHRMSEPVPYESSMCYFGASIGIGIGIAKSDTRTFNASELLANADIALYRAKQRGRGCYEFFTSRIKEDFDRTKALSDDILIALKQQQFRAFYQLQFDAETLTVVGAEALVRWQHPQKGLLAPNAFLDTAYSLNAIKDIDHQIMKIAAHDLHAFDALGSRIPKLSINLSAQRLEDPAFLNQVEDAQLDPKRFNFELTETVHLDAISQAARDNLEAIMARGYEIEIDDFGTGHASILAVQTLQPKRLKIPRELVLSIREDKEQRALVETIVKMSHSLGAAVVAEGIEDFETGEILRDLGCNTLQGFAYAKPAAPGDIVTLLTKLQYGSDLEQRLSVHDVRALAA